MQLFTAIRLCKLTPDSQMKIPLKVLIIEDSEEDVILLLRQLQKGGYDPVWRQIETSEAMLKALEKEEWDIILCDFNMPCFDGRAALELLKKISFSHAEHGNEFDIPFIVISGFLAEETAVEVLKAGAKDFIEKGNWSRLIPAISRELRDAEILRERRRAL